MILRKPYAFLIKNFKIIHLILVIAMSYLLYRTNILFNFFQEYIASTQLLIGKDFTGTLFQFSMFTLPFVIIVCCIILLSVMYYKKKPFIYYTLNILAYITVLVIYNIAFSTAGTLETQIIDVRNIRLVRDLVMMLMLLQGITVVFTFVRATGFDIKKFNFGQDLEELEIEDEDSEEFEVNINVETNVIHRGINKNFRFARYIYIENRFLINTIFLITFSIVCFIIYANITIYNKTYNEGEPFNTDATGFLMTVEKSYITNQDYKGKKITENHLVVLELSIRRNYTYETTLNTARAELVVDGKTYHPNNKYRSYLFDLGHTYYNEIIPLNSTKFLLVYEIPSNQKDSSFLFQYIDDIQFGRGELNPKTIKVKLNPYDLDKESKVKEIELNNSIVLNNKVLGNTNIAITDFNINKEFVINYQFCPTKIECILSKEYIRPIANTNYNKTILQITGVFNKDQEIEVPKIYDIYTIIKYFGKIKYTINNEQKTQDIGFTNLKPVKTEDKNNQYIEVLDEIENATDVELIIRIRNNVYKYIVK